MRLLAYISLLLAMSGNAVVAQSAYDDLDCDTAWEILVFSYPDDVAIYENQAAGDQQFSRFLMAASLYKEAADFIDGRAPVELDLAENAIGLLVSTMATSERVMVCNGGPVLLGTATTAFQQAFNQFDGEYSIEDRYELRLMYGEYL